LFEKVQTLRTNPFFTYFNCVQPENLTLKHVLALNLVFHLISLLQWTRKSALPFGMSEKWFIVAILERKVNLIFLLLSINLFVLHVNHLCHLVDQMLLFSPPLKHPTNAPLPKIMYSDVYKITLDLFKFYIIEVIFL
jgi:hypothetical protein